MSMGERERGGVMELAGEHGGERERGGVMELAGENGGERERGSDGVSW